MYRVILMYGTEEPWWFLENWKKDIVCVEEFENFTKALKYYKSQWLSMSQVYEKYKSQDDLLSAFWETKDQVWCEECSDYQQRYHSLALLEDWHELPDEKRRWAYCKSTAEQPEKRCQKKSDASAMSKNLTA